MSEIKKIVEFMNEFESIRCSMCKFIIMIQQMQEANPELTLTEFRDLLMDAAMGGEVEEEL